MTEVELSHLLSSLSETAAVLNQESDSINELIERFQEKLRAFNIGLDVWLDSDPLKTEKCNITYQDEDVPGEVDTHLGFVKIHNEWTLCIREVEYIDEGNDDWKEILSRSAIPLLKASRELRLAALPNFPGLVRALQGKAKEAIDKIEQSKKFVDLC